MENYRLTRQEQETIVNFNELEHTAEIYTCSSRIMDKFDKLVSGFPSYYKLLKQDDYSKTYSAPRNFMAKSISRKPRILTEEQKDALRKSFAKNVQSKPESD